MNEPKPPRLPPPLPQAPTVPVPPHRQVKLSYSVRWWAWLPFIGYPFAAAFYFWAQEVARGGSVEAQRVVDGFVGSIFMTLAFLLVSYIAWRGSGRDERVASIVLLLTAGIAAAGLVTAGLRHLQAAQKNRTLLGCYVAHDHFCISPSLTVPMSTTSFALDSLSVSACRFSSGRPKLVTTVACTVHGPVSSCCLEP